MHSTNGVHGVPAVPHAKMYLEGPNRIEREAELVQQRHSDMEQDVLLRYKITTFISRRKIVTLQTVHVIAKLLITSLKTKISNVLFMFVLINLFIAMLLNPCIRADTEQMD